MIYFKIQLSEPVEPRNVLAAFEKEIVDTCEGNHDPEMRNKVASELGAPSMINKIIGCGYKTLRLIHYFTAGKDEVKCWTIREGWKAP